MAKKGMHRADNIYDKNKNRAEIVPELQGGDFLIIIMTPYFYFEQS